ncbi:molecular chaperone DnaJ [Pseudoxanthobacter soli DSM 19599]|uniref:Chaperone protein DnaJ n=1 Tax=Pseudoxanthobacter soli DSM 19599 TaxID=1123029 RepID=A0A1M7ZE45_9HYPH|nr:molecular chaperone DnaJ [Pseudoxanthobacter soli]SHO63144.1 molecular chaperone DnaJ [Pseudoxanthobacter soli DSM 19599]
MAKRDYYEVLGVGRDADEKTLKSAFRKLAMGCHPDRHPGDPEAETRFKELNEAYDVLKDTDKRAAYDRFGHAAFEHGMGQGGAGFGNDFASAMSDIFDEFFGMSGRRGAGGGRGGRERGADLRYNLEIGLEEAFAGRTVEVRIPASITCDECSGSGARAGTSPTTCRTCSGTGRVRAAQGFFTLERTCPTCQGRGETISDPCPKCGGAGRITEERSLSVNIPAGIEDGTRIRLSGEGEAGARGGPPGDLYIFLSIRPHEFFQRDGSDIYCRVPVPMTTAALGGEIDVPTISGAKARVRIPEGTQTGRQFRVKGKGMPVMRTAQFGDMYIQAVVETPRNLTRRQREILEEFQHESGADPQTDEQGFFAKVKDFFDGLGG